MLMIGNILSPFRAQSELKIMFIPYFCKKANRKLFSWLMVFYYFCSLDINECLWIIN